MSLFLQVAGFGVVTAAVLAMAAVGATLQIRVTNFINFAYGDFLTFGAYCTYTSTVIGLPFPIAALAGAACVAVLAVACSIFIFEPFTRRRARVFTLLVVTIAVSFVLQNSIAIIWGPDAYRYHLPNAQALNFGPLLMTPIDIGLVATSAVILTGLHLVLQYTKFGKSLRALSNNPDLAAACGINCVRLTRVIWGMSGFFAGLGGVGLVLQLNALRPTSGFNELFLIMGAVIIGGLGRPLGAIAGAIVIGMCLEIVGTYLPGGYNLAAAFAVIVVVLVLRPQGIFRARGIIA